MRSKKALKNLSVSMLYQIISIICGLITPRLILGAYGSTYNGVVNSAKQFLSMVTILNLGIAGATRVALYKTLADKDNLATSRIVKATQIYMRKVGAVVIIYAGVLALVYPIISHNDLSQLECAVLIGIISVGTFAEYFFGMANKTLVTADQTGYIIYIFNAIAIILNTIITAILISMGCSVFVVYLGASSILFMNPLVLSIYVKKRYKLVRDCRPDDSAIKSRGAVAFHSIANIVHNNTDLLILTLFEDAKVISVYTVYYLVIGKIKSIMQVLTNGMEAAFGNMWVKKEYEGLKRNFRTYEYVLYVSTCVVFCCVGMLILPFVGQYTKGVTDIEYLRVDLAILVTLAEAIFCVRQPYVTLVQATGNYEATKKGAAVEAIINLSLSLVLVMKYGIIGVIIGTLVANIFRTLQYSIFVSKKILRRDMKEVLLRMGWLIATSVSIIVAVRRICLYVTVVDSWSGWIVQAGYTFVIASVLACFSALIFYYGDTKHLYSVIIRMMQRKNK